MRLAVFQFRTNSIVLHYFGLSRKHPPQFGYIINAERGLVRWDVKIALKKQQQKKLNKTTLFNANTTWENLRGLQLWNKAPCCTACEKWVGTKQMSSDLNIPVSTLFNKLRATMPRCFFNLGPFSLIIDWSLVKTDRCIKRYDV